jgi:rod shape determining protein RodA
MTDKGVSLRDLVKPFLWIILPFWLIATEPDLGSAMLVLLVWGVNIALRSRENFGTVMAVGIVSMIGWQVFINVGMTMGLMPVVGVPLPLISYGGSSSLTTMVGIGLLMNISMRRFLFKKSEPS